MYPSLISVTCTPLKTVCFNFLSSSGLLKSLIIIIITSIAYKATAQDFFPTQTDFGIRIGADYDVPGKNLSGYKAGANYNITLMKYLDKFTIGITGAYRQYNNKQAQWGEAVAWNNWANYTASPYTTYSVYLSAVYNVDFTDRVKLYGGANMGVYNSKSSMYYQDDFTYWYQGYNQRQMYFAPKLGACFALNNNWDIDLHAAYNVFTEGGSLSYNSRSGSTGTSSSIYTSLSTGLGLVVKF